MEPTATLVEAVGDRCVVVTPANTTLTTEELDHSFYLPYERAPHPRYAGKGDIPAWEMIRHSVNIHRGCFGGCSFCTISAHQGKFIHSRSERSILDEVRRIAPLPKFISMFTTARNVAASTLLSAHTSAMVLSPNPSAMPKRLITCNTA